MRRKCIFGCNNVKNSLFKFPKNDDIKKRWIRFVTSHLDGKLRMSTNTRLCSKHFTPDSFINFHRRQLGYTDNPLLLVNGAVPTIFRPDLHPSSVSPRSSALVGSTSPPMSVSCLVCSFHVSGCGFSADNRHAPTTFIYVVFLLYNFDQWTERYPSFPLWSDVSQHCFLREMWHRNGARIKNGYCEYVTLTNIAFLCKLY